MSGDQMSGLYRPPDPPCMDCKEPIPWLNRMQVYVDATDSLRAPLCRECFAKAITEDVQ